MKPNKNFTAEQLKDLETAVTLGMSTGWIHNSGKSSRACCTWKPITHF
jgi:hypothetical protein